MRRWEPHKCDDTKSIKKKIKLYLSSPKFIPRLQIDKLLSRGERGKMLMRPSLLISFQMRSFIQSLNWFYADGMIQQQNNEEVDFINSTNIGRLQIDSKTWEKRWSLRKNHNVKLEPCLSFIYLLPSFLLPSVFEMVANFYLCKH